MHCLVCLLGAEDRTEGCGQNVWGTFYREKFECTLWPGLSVGPFNMINVLYQGTSVK